MALEFPNHSRNRKVTEEGYSVYHTDEVQEIFVLRRFPTPDSRLPTQYKSME
ncbi:hypothetical protein [Moorena sp. SIO4G3]|uniref:hypothetical protein n=1 Tax=Moorena sp. SIO4G3 TaxID=2607821 RepID=UPI0014292A30|nr:hypothetical protein [Moorena sp. SIO4G3]NEO78765.1 hypothetical protein [Moorena sp. SIO4G3]